MYAPADGGAAMAGVGLVVAAINFPATLNNIRNKWLVSDNLDVLKSFSV